MHSGKKVQGGGLKNILFSWVTFFVKIGEKITIYKD
jgi:hypothetical protein